MRLKVPFFGYVLAIIGLVLPSVILAALMPSLINAEPVKQRLIAELRDWAGSDIQLGGPVSIENFFSLSVNLQNVEFKGLKGIPSLKTLHAEHIVARLSWTDLISGNLDFNKIKIIDSTAHVTGIGAGDLAAAVIGMIAPPEKIPFTTFVLTNCVVRIDAPPGAPRERFIYIDSVSSNLRKSDQRIELDGRLKWQDETFSFETVTYAPLTAASAAPVPLQVTATSRLLDVSFDGSANLAGYLTGAGKFISSTPNLLALAKWLELDPGAVIAEPVSVAGVLNLTGSRAVLQSAAFSLAGEHGSGDINIGLEAGGPKIDGALAFEDVDVRKLWALSLSDQRLFPAKGDAEWRFFQQADLDVSISANRPRWDALPLGPVAFTLTGKAGMLTAEIAELGLLGGSLLGHVELDLSGDTARASARLTGGDLEADQLLALAAQPIWLSGEIDANIEAEASGQTPAELYKSATVNARLAFPQGGQIQLDLPRLSAPGQTFDRDGWEGGGFVMTPFERLRMQLIVDDEVLRFTDLDLQGGGGMVRGMGDVDLANRTLDWQLWVLSRANPGAQGGPAPAQEQGAIGSLSVKGPWSRPAIRLVDQSKKAGTRGEANSSAGAPAGKL
jgi:AsmA protein